MTFSTVYDTRLHDLAGDVDGSVSSLEIQQELHQESSSLISQEIRTPLTSIRGTLCLLRSGYLGNVSEQGLSLLDTALGNADRMVRLAQSLENQSIFSCAILSEPEMHRLQLENDLRLAWQQRDFQLYYQPIVSLSDRTITGFEALIRWHHPDRGWVSPATFIPIAEELGLIEAIGLWVLKEACSQLRQWQAKSPEFSTLTVNVNLSMNQLLQPNLASQIQQICDEEQVSPQSVNLEITEGALVDNAAQAIATVAKLKQMGFRLYVDDFGTGYSSLARLGDFPLDALKIDRSFIRDKKWHICKIVMLLASTLGLDVVAEGIETGEDLETLKQLGCEQMQGYLFSAPLNADHAESLLTDLYQF